jgi:predicted glutamine amidotransferase
MCRLLGVVAAKPESAEEWLVRSERSLLTQSNASPETAQKDGWGIGWFAEPNRVRIEKGVGGAFEDGERDRFVRVAAGAWGNVVVGHLRHASNPLGLPHEQLISLVNSQPFGTHTTLFAHNGAIAFPNETRPYLGVHEKEVLGVNDSEVLFRLLLRHYEEIRDPFRAYAHALDDLDRVWIDVGRPRASPYSGLNVLFAPNPQELWAFCYSVGDHGCGLLDRTRPYYEMTYYAEPHRVVVGSEPFDTTPGRWTPLRSGTFLHATARGTHVTVETGAIPIPTLAAAKAVPG